MKTTKKIKIGIGAVLFVMIFLFLHFNLPRTAVVQISGTDIKRMDKAVDVKDKEDSAEKQVQAVTSTEDVRFVNSVSRKGKPMVFKNFMKFTNETG